MNSQVCIITEGGEVLDRASRTEVYRFEKLLGGRPRARILIEASTESEWVARCLESLGHEVVVANPNFAAIRRVRPSRPLSSEIAPFIALMEPLRDQIQVCDARVREHAKEDEVVRRLCTAPGIGPLTAATFVATLDTAERFERAHQVEAYLGLVPREMSSGEKQRKGRITKTGNSRARSLLIELAWCILRWKKPETEGLRIWAERIAGRRGKSKAAVALARRLAGMLFAMWRDGTEYAARHAVVQTEESRVTT